MDFDEGNRGRMSIPTVFSMFIDSPLVERTSASTSKDLDTLCQADVGLLSKQCKVMSSAKEGRIVSCFSTIKGRSAT